ncbi:thiol:disulfide interchange protein DsbA/DsbL [Orbus wheelerorum]|uniref:thiol:disulfide interchange protein DsbA/DsbL n=1 Tax=Orbus wheelerorum TaxID=3074111 RepID=UPI00370D0933
MVFSLILMNSAFAALVENKDYVMLEKPIEAAPTKEAPIEVVEFFSYGCPYCYMLEPQINSWLAQKPDNVIFTRIAIPRKGKWVEYARLFYALGMISKQEQERITPLIYNAIHEQKLNFNDADEIFDWAESNNIDKALLKQFYNSKDVTEKLEQAVILAHSYHLKYVPSIYINGKYQLLINSSNQYQDVKDKLNQLKQLIEIEEK